jgi:cytochrome oxidase Cu insertion factor (SCO1/SenC/PrrC family)
MVQESSAVTRRRLIAAWMVTTVAFAVAGSLVAYHLARPANSNAAPPRLHGQAVWAEGARAAPGFTLRNQEGRMVSLRSLRGRVVLLTFLDSRCTTLCPIEGALLRRVQDAASPGRRPAIVVVSVDPTDTPGSVRAFVDHRARWTGRWDWLMGTKAELKPIWRTYGIEVKAIRRHLAGVTYTDIAHTAALYVIDPAGYERSGYLMPFLPAQVIDDVRALAAA